MLTIRLTRKGKKNQPFFRVVVIDKRSSAKGGRAVEDLGYVDPLNKKKNFKKDRILYWLSKGAKTSATVHNFLVEQKIIDAKKINVVKLPKKEAAAPAVGSPEPLASATEAKEEPKPEPAGEPSNDGAAPEEPKPEPAESPEPARNDLQSETGGEEIVH